MPVNAPLSRTLLYLFIRLFYVLLFLVFALRFYASGLVSGTFPVLVSPISPLMVEKFGGRVEVLLPDFFLPAGSRRI